MNKKLYISMILIMMPALAFSAQADPIRGQGHVDRGTQLVRELVENQHAVGYAKQSLWEAQDQCLQFLAQPQTPYFEQKRASFLIHLDNMRSNVKHAERKYLQSQDALEGRNATRVASTFQAGRAASSADLDSPAQCILS